MRTPTAAALLLLASTGAARAQSPSPSTTASARPAPAPCTAPEHRQFDFWLGDWTVTGKAGKLAGTNLVTRELGGCVLQEHWKGAGPTPVTGSSFNVYDASRKKWHQTWVDSTGTLLLLDGGLDEEGAMVLEGEAPSSKGGTVHHTIRWEKLPGGRVRQLWTYTVAGGPPQVAFDGTYAPTTAN